MIETSTADSAYDEHPAVVSETLQTFLQKMTKLEVCKETEEVFLALPEKDQKRVKNYGKAWSPARFSGGKKSEHVVDIGALGFDVDKDDAGNDGITDQELETLIEYLDSLDVSYAVHSSFSSGLVRPRHKIRIVLPLAHNVPIEEFKALWLRYAEELPVHVDTSCKNPDRIFFLPRVLSGHEAHFMSHVRDDRPLLRSAKPKNLLGVVDLNRAQISTAKTEEEWLEAVRTADLKDDARNQAAFAIAMQYARRRVAVEIAHSEVWEKIRKALSENQVSTPVEDWEGAESKTFRAVRRAYEKEEADRADNLKVAQEKAATIEVTDKLVDQARKELERGRRAVKKDDKSVDIWGKKVGKFVPHVLGEDLVKSELTTAWKENKNGNCMDAKEFSRRLQMALDVGAAFPAGLAEDWEKSLIRGKEGEVVACDENMFLALKHHPDTQGILVHSVRYNCTRVTRVPPWDSDGDFPRDFKDADAYAIAIWTSEKLRTGSLGYKRALEAAIALSRETVVDEFRDYLDTLTWDRTPRLHTWLTDYLGCAQDAYTAVVGAKWLIGAAARAYEEGAKMDNMLIFVGVQGKKKSMVFENLLPSKDFHTDNLPDIEDKDVHVTLSRSVISEMAEMDHLSKRDVGKVKHFITGRSGKIRPAYGRSEVDFPRRGVLCGTTNERDGFLNDPTGARRFWPVEVETMALAHDVTITRDQLWAEAKSRYQEGRAEGGDYLWWLSPEEEKLAKVRQDAADIEDASAWEFESYMENFPAQERGKDEERVSNPDEPPNLNKSDNVRMYLYPEQVTVEGKVEYVTILQVCQFLRLPEHDTRSQTRALALLKACKWRKMPRKLLKNGKKVSPWVRSLE